MPDTLVLLLPTLSVLAFVFAVGACVGSLINVLVYRIPRGLGVVVPSSKCPHCNTKLSFRENIPILGWIILRGRCRHCRARISREYPIVESAVAVLFAGIYALWYIAAPGDTLLGVPIGAIAPEWAHNGAALTWPAMVVVLTLIASLVAMTLIDARTYTIPLVLTWTPALVALAAHTAHGVWFSIAHGNPIPIEPGVWRFPGMASPWESAPGWLWTIPTPDPSGWGFIGLALGGAIGLLVANALLALGVLTRSFDDYEDWAQKHRADRVGEAVDDAHEWIQYPHARREMVRELAFLAPAAAMGVLGAWLAPRIVAWIGGAWTFDPVLGAATPPFEAPLWLTVLAGVLSGYLIGAGVVWAVRILGSVAFKKEAMGLGDVHMMGAVGACVGWIDATVAFFLAAFVALAIVLVGALARSGFVRAMPYGPSLAIATTLVILAKPLIEMGLGYIFAMGAPYPIP